ncbi:ribulose-phosphate 3-epimerase [Thermoflavimicrobium dichotomicum]|uniref:Ribulose-phosphate 3-epimerase n=1 Tax=Thermoflavimicrobium dichotomicum TaxID=46223 RepID=A0A1I3TLF6_9BACL|nr:ribulose-phosphate 3-epimerase [Thermoflavimicrobium dichotomicum]SFJ71715.1 ribulose-phosphate 3-epimerase [Thermoflavimicrobium dichotomicum]
MQYRRITIAPSIMCADLCNLEKSVKELEKEGFDTLHVDIIDGYFSPSMPLGIDTIKQLRKITNMNFDIHIMANNNEFFIQEMIKIGVQQISFHVETSIHIDRYIQLIKKNGIKVGIALNPATSLSVLDYVLPQCDTILLMLINPGFATDKNEKQVSYAIKKVEDLYQLIKEKGLDTRIEVDGRVSFDTIPGLVRAGADILVAGSTSLFMPSNSLAENKKSMEKYILEGLSEEVK